MAGQLGGTPIMVLADSSEVTKGREAQNRNITAAKAIASMIRTTLGPRGMDKMLVFPNDDALITNDGAAVLRRIELQHPAAKIIVEVAKTQDNEVGDGTTAAVVIAGELLKQAEELIELEVHPTIITSGYQLASEKAKEILGSIATTLAPEDESTLKKIAITAMNGKDAVRDSLAELAVKAVLLVAQKVEGKYVVSAKDISIEKRTGSHTANSELIKGIIIEKGRMHSNMPKKVENAKIALINASLEVKPTKADVGISIKSPDQLHGFLAGEEKLLKGMADKIANSGANVLFCQKGIDEIVQHYLSKAGIMAVKRVRKTYLQKLARATGAKIVNKVHDITASDLGKAGLVEERDDFPGQKMIFVKECENPKAVSLLLRGGTQQVVDELERTLQDALRVVRVAIEEGKIISGGGSSEVELALRLREYSASLSGKEQLAVAKFANALESIPRTLAENAGLDPIDMLVALRAQHEKGKKTAGLDVYKGKVIDMMEAGVVEPLRVRTQAISSATEAAVMILRIDDVIAADRMDLETPLGAEGAQGMPPGGVPPMM
ncbi:MAG: thermosome subunit alpha [Methanocellales archaeon]|nr:thermosome subunit alpha [Methanocellales archaeon]MDD3291108.1 thermosome subunit alpha [Methanocellales archaeon]MDD5234993.1 thermosome subunit alpha [Methanocellales archaeon]MDD5484636.1 thermosome subunit alpha [Methanocellales archaeon]